MKSNGNKPRARRKLGGVSLTNRSKITNGSALAEYVDGRSAWARRFRDLICAYAQDLGGPDCLSEGQLAIIRRAALLQVELEFQESKFAQLHEADELPGAKRVDHYQRTAGALRRLIESLGLHQGRKQRDVTPTIDEYARHVREQEATPA